jgi:hypothetical protein
MLITAVRHDQLTAAKWLKKQGASWPTDEWSLLEALFYRGCSEQVAQWALVDSSLWRTWQCHDRLSRAVREDGSSNSCIIELVEWAHKHGCPCTCSEEEKQLQRERVLELDLQARQYLQQQQQ